MDLRTNNARATIRAAFAVDRQNRTIHEVGHDGLSIDVRAEGPPMIEVTIEGQHGEATALLRILLEAVDLERRRTSTKA